MTWMRPITGVLGGLLALATLGGCKQQLFLEPGDYMDAAHFGIPKDLETNPHDTIVPPTVSPVDGGPATVLDPNRPPKYVSLKECIAIALEQGNVGSTNPQQPGFKIETVDIQAGRTFGTSDYLRAFALDPAIAGADIERSLSKFDARWLTSMIWQKNDAPVAAQFVSFQSQNDQATFTSTLAKPLPTGGIAGITFSTNYTKFPAQIQQTGNFVNPNYTPRLQFVFEQPLLRLFGVEVNQLASSPPSSLLIPGLQPSGGNGVDGILLTRITYDQTRSVFELRVNYLLLNTEAAYWNLYSAYYNLYAQEDGLRSSFEGYRFTEARVIAGQDPPQNLNQARAQFELFRGQVYRARGQVLQAERQLRGMMGLRSDDGTRLVPIDEPNLAQLRPDFYDAANETMAYRPELLLARQDLKARQFQLLLAKNLRRPDLRFISSYDVAGIGTRLDGPEFLTNAQTGAQLPGNAFSSFANNQFNSWQLGLRLDMPLGFRDANAQVRQSQLTLTRSYYQLRDTELKALEFLVDQYRRVYETHSLIAPAKSRREALQIYVYKVKQLIEVGKWDSTVFFNYLQVQRDLAQSIADEFAAVAAYQTALAQIEWAKGTIMRYNNISLAEGPLPAHVATRAADHIRERTEAAIKLKERAGYQYHGDGHQVGPAGGDPFAIPALSDPRPATPEQLPNREMLPEPKPGAAKDPTPMPPPAATNPNSTGVQGTPFRPWPTGAGAAQPAAAQPVGGSAAGDVYFSPADRVRPARANGMEAPVSAPASLPSMPPAGAGLTVPPVAPGGFTPQLPPVPTAPFTVPR